MLKNDGSAVNSSEHVQLLFLSESCVVSKAATQLMDLVHQILKVYKMRRLNFLFQFFFAVVKQLYLVISICDSFLWL